MIEDVENSIIEIIKKYISSVPTDNIIAGAPDLKEIKLPLVSFENQKFSVEDLGMGASSGEGKQKVQDKLTGDGKTGEFKLGKTPLRAPLEVEHPPGTPRRETDDYTVDYEKGILKFRLVPGKGKDNISVNYLTRKSVSETRGLKFNLKYNLCAWAKSGKERDSISLDLIKLFLIAKDEMEDKGIVIRATGGRNITGDNIPEGVFGKEIECRVECEVYIDVPYERIRKVEIESKVV